MGKLARECLDEGAKACGVGVTTDEIDRIVHEGETSNSIQEAVFVMKPFIRSCHRTRMLSEPAELLQVSEILLHKRKRSYLPRNT